MASPDSVVRADIRRPCASTGLAGNLPSTPAHAMTPRATRSHLMNPAGERRARVTRVLGARLAPVEHGRGGASCPAHSLPRRVHPVYREPRGCAAPALRMCGVRRVGDDRGLIWAAV